MKKILFLSVVFVSLIFLNVSCSKKSEIAVVSSSEMEISVTKKNHSWYYFTGNGYIKTDRPKNSPFMPELPWTEAVRISDSNCCAETLENNTNAFAVVNRLGILCFDDEKITLARDESLFPDRTAGNLVFFNNTPIFSVYKSSFFNDSLTDPLYKNDQNQHLFLVQFDNLAKISYPLINCNNLLEEINSEVTDFAWDGTNWICSVKTITDVKNSFSYIGWKPNAPLLSLSPVMAEENLHVWESDVESFRKAKELRKYSDAPERVKKLLAGFDKKKNFVIEIKTAGGYSSRTYENGVVDSEEPYLNAKAIISQSWSCAIFEDGTLYLEGALPGKHILRGGKAVAIRLPKLPEGFVYSDFVISGTTLYAAWEESSFYKTGRSGFLSVNLEKTLYSKL